MKILVVAHEKELNGASLSLLDIIDYLSVRHQFWVVTSYGDGPFYETMKERNIHIVVQPFERWMVRKNHPLKWPLKSLRWRLIESNKNRKTAYEIAKVIQENNIDLIYTNTRVIDIGLRCARLTGKPHVWHFREFGEEDFDMYPLVTAREHFGRIGKNTDVIICNSRAVYAKFLKKIHGKAKLCVVYNGVAKPEQKSQHTNEKVRFLITGRISRAKGQLDAVLAVNELVKRGYTEFELLVAGPQSENYLELQREAEKNRGMIKFLGMRTDMPYLRSITDVELVCSRMEAFGRVTVEAMLAGNPVIGKNAGGTTELIEEGKNGFLYEPGNIKELADKMEKLIKEPARIKEIGEYAAEYAKDRFLIEVCAKKIEEIFIEVCKN
ncbi:MAG: glycosyltransferase family 4 protein [Lachnospiraceae bacterium]|nr:glycosyltransferase family 4 protein [Robinsoniella sp.]MDY3765650.1 glycosyltransferase family 4 protein [Lachnospiraceae bacterium]